MARALSLATLALLLVSCSKPGPVAKAACEALPGLAVDAAGLALLEPVMHDSELELLRAAAPTKGLEVVGSDGLAALRAATSCEIVDAESGGQYGWWAVRLKRTAPVVGEDGAQGAPETVDLEWEVVKTEAGLRAKTGLARAVGTRGEIDAAMAEGDTFRAASLWRALAKSYADPTSPVDVAWVAAEDAKAMVAKKLRHDLVGQSEDGLEVLAETTNGAQRSIKDAKVRFIFATEPPTTVEVQTGPLAIGAKASLKAKIPEGFTGKVKMETAELTL